VPGELRDPGGWASHVSPLKCYIRQDSEAQRAALGRRLELRASTLPSAAEEFA